MIPRLGLSVNEMLLGIVLMVMVGVQVGLAGMLIGVHHNLKTRLTQLAAGD